MKNSELAAIFVTMFGSIGLAILSIWWRNHYESSWTPIYIMGAADVVALMSFVIAMIVSKRIDRRKANDNL